MPEEQDTGVEITPETEPSEVIGTPVEESTPGPEAQEAQDKVDKEEYERLKKELDKKNQEINLHKNKAEKARLEALQENGNWEEMAKELQARLDDIEAEKTKEETQKTLDGIRENVLKGYAPEVQEVAKDLDLWWDSADTTFEAEQQLRAKLDKIATRIGGKPQDESQQPDIHPNNPAVENMDVDFDDMDLDEMRKVLPRAEARF